MFDNFLVSLMRLQHEVLASKFRHKLPDPTSHTKIQLLSVSRYVIENTTLDLRW